MTMNSVNLKYLENHYLPRIAEQYNAEKGIRDPVSNAANTAIISSISATITNIFQFVIPHGIPKIAVGAPSFVLLAQNLTLGAFSTVLGVFALGRFKQSMTLAKEQYQEDTKVLASSKKWGTSLQESLTEDIVEVTQLQANIDSKDVQFIKKNLICFILGMVLVAANAILASLSLEIFAMITIYAMIGVLVLFAYNLGSHWDDNIINKKKIEALHVNHIIKKLHTINSPEDTSKKSDHEKITLELIKGEKDSMSDASSIISEANGPQYSIVGCHQFYPSSCKQPISI